MTGPAGAIRVGVDIGGTFTDLQIYDGRVGRTVSHKTPTTPDDPSIGLVQGLKDAGQRFAFALADISHILHGTTIATNAVLQRKFPKGALITTRGFEDVLEIGRHARRDIYSVKPQRPDVLIPRNMRVGIAERMRANGTVETALNAAALDDLVATLGQQDIATVAVALLNAYVNPTHEQAIAARLARDLPALAVSISSDVSPEIREYERSNTTVLNALLMPVVKRYLDRLAARFREENIAARLLIVQSNGGVVSPATAAREPVRLLLSGPSGGALGARAIARTLRIPDLVGVDMGGTSFDVSVVRDDRIEIITQGEIDQLPVRVPMIEIRTIGAGGGSIARVDATRRVTVGPESAGARPGPVCYGHGGTEPTVTDANLLLGRLDAAYFLGGAMTLDLEGARQALDNNFARPLGLDVERAADGIIAITNTSLAAAIRVSLFEKGLDPRDFTLLSFGGAGAIHACAVADELGVTRIVFPTHASTFSAWGILHSDIGHDYAKSRVMVFDDAAVAPIAEAAAALRATADTQLAGDGVAPPDRHLKLAADLRYKGQAFELTIPWAGHDITVASRAATADAFHAAHKQRFSYSDPGAVVEVVTLRLSAIGKLGHTAATEAAIAATATAALKSRRVWLNDGWRDVPVFRRNNLDRDQRITGPAVIEEDYTTLLIGPGWSAAIGKDRHIVASKDGLAS